VRPEPARTEPAPPPAPELLELEIPVSSVIGLQIETPVSSERARVEDKVEARVMRDVSVDGRTAIPSGTRAIGAVTLVERGGKLKERARLGVRFHTLVLADGTQLPIRTDAIMREGESQGGDSARKIGGAAVGGAILGALIGGKKGAAIGGATGAPPAELPSRCPATAAKQPLPQAPSSLCGSRRRCRWKSRRNRSRVGGSGGRGVARAGVTRST